jgi:hypothetical protein
MGAKAGTKTPLAGQARVSQRLNSERAASAATNTDSYLDPVKVAAARKGNPTLDYLLSKERAAASAKNASQATISPLTDSDRAASAAREVEQSRKYGVPLTQTPPGGVDDYYTPALDYLLSKERAAASAKNASQATISPLTDADRAASAAREVEKSRKYGVPLTQTPPGGVDDYYTPDNLRRDYEAANPGKNFERFLSSTEAIWQGSHGSS